MALRGVRKRGSGPLKTAAVRLDAEVVREVKVAAARAGESMQMWMAVACRRRLEKEGVPLGGKKRVVSGEWEA